MEQHSKPVVLEAGEAVAGALDLLHAEVESLGRPVRSTGLVVSEYLRPPAPERVPERPDLRHVVGEAAGDCLVEEHGGDERIVGEIDVTHGLFRQPGTENVVVGITEAQPEQHPRAAAFVEPLGSREKQLSDAIEGVVLPSPVAEELVLHAPAHGVEAPVGDSHDMEGIGHSHGMVEVGAQSGSVGLRQVGGDDPHTSQPLLVGASAPPAQVTGGVAFHHVNHLLALQVDEARGVDGRVLPVGLQERGLVDTE